ncbi:Vitellogenin-5 [Folsomia candida]|uniref:Vitellogenin-5 n=1 Tax=Folsomia candida TaxID=158441 RepID=A0A226CV11_FOLCA|nr:Vitellogenin-5 [Folsomia candida]
MKWLLLFALVLSSSAFVKRDVGTNLFTPGKEFIYGFTILSLVGSDDYVKSSSTFNISGIYISLPTEMTLMSNWMTLRSEPTMASLILQTIRTNLSYPMVFVTYLILGLLQAKGIVLDKNSDEWAKTSREVLPPPFNLTLVKLISRNLIASSLRREDDNRVLRNNAQVRKFGPTHNVKILLADSDVLNSTSFSVYDLEIQEGNLVAKNIHVGSSVAYMIFVQLWIRSTPIQSQNFQRFESVFENDVKEDEDLGNPVPSFSITKVLILILRQTKAADQLLTNIKKMHNSFDTAELYKDVKEFHKVSPFSLLPFVSALNYQHIKDTYDNKVKGGDATEEKMFLDALAISGTGPLPLFFVTLLLAHPTVSSSLVTFPMAHYIRNPTENLIKELEGLIKPENTKYNSPGSSFDVKTQAILALRNVNHFKAAEKLLPIAVDNKQERSIRTMAISGITPLLKKDPLVFRKNILPIFFNRQEDSETRNLAILWTLVSYPEENTFQQIGIYMWTERDPEVKNFVITLLKKPFWNDRPISSWAKTALSMMGRTETKSKHSGIYISDYYDPQYHFAHLTTLNVQKSGHSILPQTVYFGVKSSAGGYASKYLSIFVRLEGLGKSISSRIMSMITGVIDFDEIKDIFNKIGVQERQADPLRIEICVMLHDRFVAYHAADEKTITTIPQLMKKLGELSNAAYDKEFSKMILLGGVMTEQPNELGIPVSTISGVSTMAKLHAKVKSDKSGTTMNRSYEVHLGLNVHGISSVNNHMAPFGTAHSVEALRTLRIRIPRKITFGLDVKQQSINFAISAPTEDDPIMAQVHATAVTSIHSDTPATMNDNKIVDLLHESCPLCKGMEVISKGEKFREERRLGSGYKYKALEGVNIGGKYFDCEKVHSRIHVLRQLRKFYGPEFKNLGGRAGQSLTLLRVGTRYMMSSLFLSPTTETCGMKFWYHKDLSATSVFDKVEGQAKVKYEEDPKDKLGNKLMAKSSLTFTYTGTTPKTRSLDMTLTLVKTGLEKIEVKTKLAAKDDALNKGGVVCIDIAATQAKVSDFFDYNGENEPTYERTINVAWSKDISSKDASCPANSAGIKITKKAHRSQAQKDEAQSDAWPYKQCRDQKSSPKYPGDLTPATEPCLWAAYKQTNLRESNVTINYKVDPEARNRWKYPGALVAAALMPYWVPSDTVDGHAAHGDHGVSADGHLQGELKLDVTMDDENPEADIHWHGSGGESEHFHGVDLNFLPGPLKRPVHSRFSGLMYKAFELGVYGYCDVTPHAVQTYDNATYFADLSECYTLVSGDCSDKPRFVVLGKKISNDKLGLKIMAGEHKVELNDMNNVIVDGKSQSLSDKLIFPEGDTKIFKIYKHDDNNVFLLSRPLGLAIRYTGHYTTVTIGSRFRAQQCGLCGNFDGCQKNDFTGPATTCKNLQPTDMTKAYIVREGSCAGVGSVCPSS